MFYGWPFFNNFLIIDINLKLEFELLNHHIVKMTLQPRKIKYKSRHKRRRVTIFRRRPLVYGDIALLILKPLRVSSKSFFRLKLFLKRAIRKSDFTQRLFWLSLFPHLPFSKKPKGMRMGKGIGKLSTWHTLVSGGTLLVEFKNLRKGRASYFANQVSYRLPVPTIIYYINSKMPLKLIGSRRVHYSLMPFY